MVTNDGHIANLVAISQGSFFDLLVSFVMVNHSLLFETVSLLDFWDPVLSWVSTYFSGHTFSFFFAESPASFCPLNFGVPQGSTF